MYSKSCAKISGLLNAYANPMTSLISTVDFRRWPFKGEEPIWPKFVFLEYVKQHNLCLSNHIWLMPNHVYDIWPTPV
jgi:hypothetical protein